MQMIEQSTNASCRALCGAAGVGIAEDAELMRLSREFEAAWADEKIADAVEGFDEPAYYRVSGIVGAIVEAPAASLAGLIVKARALFWLHSGDVDGEVFGGDVEPTTDMRLAWQLLRGVLALGCLDQAKLGA